MAKVPFTKLYTKEDLGKVKTFTWNEQEIEVKQYLPLIEKLNIIQNIAMTNVEGRDFLNPIEIYSALESLIVSAYTNISFTEKQRVSDAIKTYDIIKEIGLFDSIKAAIPTQELDELYMYFNELLTNIVSYRNSALSLARTFTEKSDALENAQIDFEKIKKDIGDNPQLLEMINFYQKEIETTGTKEENDNVIKLNNK